MIKKFFLLILYTGFATFSIAQDSTAFIKKPDAPIPAEVMAGNNRLFFQLILNKKLPGSNRLGFFTVSSFQGSYKNKKSDNEFMTPVVLTCRIIKNIAVTGGAAMNSQWGFRPYAGLQYIYGRPTFLAVIVPGVYLTETHNLEILALLEVKPKFNDKWSLYTRLQCLYTQNTQDNAHDRSYIYLRCGVSYKKFGFGLAANEDWYGPSKFLMENYGLFFRADL